MARYFEVGSFLKTLVKAEDRVSAIDALEAKLRGWGAPRVDKEIAKVKASMDKSVIDWVEYERDSIPVWVKNRVHQLSDAALEENAEKSKYDGALHYSNVWFEGANDGTKNLDWRLEFDIAFDGRTYGEILDYEIYDQDGDLVCTKKEVEG